MQAAAQPAAMTAAPSIARPRFEWKWVVIGLCVALTAYIAVMPLGFLLWQSFFTPQTATKAAVLTWGNYTTAYGSVETLRLFGNSLQFATGTACVAFVIG
ncbi:MAG: iron ABC transporter permease, partial [Betaproteobacteria bacterium]|nr:iron ABC transporter permease [Betaproteobacteria bacterium]